MGIVTNTPTSIKGKLAPRGKICMFVGYPDDTTPDVYRMLNIKTNKIIKSKDIFWLNKTYGQYLTEKDYTIITEEEDSDTEVV